MKKKQLLMLILVLLLTLSGIAIYYYLNHRPNLPEHSLLTDDSAEEWTGEKDLYNPQEEVPTIEIPGITSLVFQPESTKQNVNFYNPEINNCLFKMTLYVDNAECWQSGYVEPGKGFYEIELSESLEVGSYDAYLLIECFKENGLPLNGAHVDFNLIVK